jgi:hypothetical protein
VHSCAEVCQDRQSRRRGRQRRGRQVPAGQQGGAGLPDRARCGPGIESAGLAGGVWQKLRSGALPGVAEGDTFHFRVLG